MTSCFTENESFVGPTELAQRFGQRFRPRLHIDDLQGLRQSIQRILDSMPPANAQRHYIEALDMRVDEWLEGSEGADFTRPRVSLADLDVMLRVSAHPLACVTQSLITQITRMIEVVRSGGW